jgi:predicted metal-binding protein
MTTHASERIFFSTGFPPRALLKCVQSGENHAMPTGCPPHAFLGLH